MAEEFTAKFKVDISDLKKNIDQAQQSIKKANATFKAETAGMEKWTKDADGLDAKMKQLDTTLNAQKSILAAYESELKRNKEAYDQNGKRAEELRKKLQELADQGVSKTSDEYKKYKQELTDTEKEQAKNEKAIQKLDIQILEQTAAVKDTEKQMRHYEQTLDDLGKEEDQATKDTEELEKATKDAGKEAQNSSGGFTVMKGAMASLVADGIKLAISALKDLAQEVYKSWEAYDNGLDNIIKKTGATGEAAKDLQKAYDEVSSAIVGDFANIGDAVGEVSTRFGVTGRQLSDLTTKFMKFAEVNGTDVTGAIDSAQAAMAAWGIEAKDAGEYLDLITAAAQATGTNVDAINSSLLTNATAFKELGMSVEDTTFFLASLEKSGVDTSTVLTGMKKALAAATKEGKPLSTTMADLEKRILEAKDSTEAMSIASEVFGTKAGPALATAVRDGNLSFKEMNLTMEDYQGVLEKTYDDTLDGSDKIQLALQNLKKEAGKTFGEFMDKHGPEITAFVNKFIKEYLPVIIQWLDKTFHAIEVVIQVLSRWGQILKDIGSAARYEIERIKGFFDGLGQKVSAIWEGLKSGAVGAFNAVKNTFAALPMFFSNIWDRVKTTFSALGTKIGEAIGGAVKKGINGVISRIETIINSAIGLINGAINLINKIPGVSVGKVGRLSLPRLAQGGVLAKGQIGLLEGSGAEAVVPLERNKQWVSAVADDMVRELTGNNTTINRRSIANNYTQIINTPKAPSRIEIYRQTRNLLELTTGRA